MAADPSNFFTPLGSIGARMGGAFGEAAARPLQQSLDFLAQRKMQQLSGGVRSSDFWNRILPEGTHPSVVKEINQYPAQVQDWLINSLQNPEFKLGPQGKQLENLLKSGGQQAQPQMQQPQNQQESGMKALQGAQPMTPQPTALQQVIVPNQQQAGAQQQQQPMMPQQQMQAPAPAIAQQQYPSIKLGKTEAGVGDKQQKAIETKNAPYVKEISKNAERADKMEEIANQMLDLWNTGNVDYGWTGAYWPTQGQNQATQDFSALADQLAAYKLETLGNPTNAKIKFAQQQKPNIGQDKNTQKFLLDRALSDAGKLKKQFTTMSDIIEANGGKEPANLQDKVRKSIGSSDASKQDLQVGSMLDELPLGNDVPVGSEATNQETGESFVYDGKRWAPKKSSLVKPKAKSLFGGEEYGI